jgi:peptidoglycan/LPS O-acetylase OafA/YrhL
MSDTPRLTRHRPPLNALTGIRFFAAVYVVVFHTRVAAFLGNRGFGHAANFFANGYLAVPLFFMLSGWILAYTYRGQIETALHRKHFWEARFARIWPAYAFSLLLSSLVMHSAPTAGLRVATLLMVQAWNPLHPEYAGAWNMVCWTLSVEAFFYLCFPWCQLWLERQSPRALRLCAAMFVAAGIVAHTAVRTLGDPSYSGIFRCIPLPVIHLPEFLAGVAAGNLFLESAPQEKGRRRGLLTWLGMVASVASLSIFRGDWSGTCLLGFALLLYGLATERTCLARLLSSKPLLLGGAISYSIYLLQTPVRLYVKQVFARMHWGDGLLSMIAVAALIPFLALAVFFWIEEPSRRFLRARFAQLSGPRGAA